jgi:hypothetical protein
MMYDPNTDSDFDGAMRHWLVDGDAVLNEYSTEELDEFRSVADAKLDKPVYRLNARLQLFAMRLKDLLSERLESTPSDEYPPCPICHEPIDYCQGHGEDNAREVEEYQGLMPVPERVVPGTLELVSPDRGLEQLEVDEDGCIENPDDPGGHPIGYVVSREWFLSAQALVRDLDAGERELRMPPTPEEQGRPRTAPGTLVNVLHPFSGSKMGLGVVLGHEVGMYDHGSPESGPGPVEDTDLTRVLMLTGENAGMARLVLDSDLDELEDQKSSLSIGRSLTRRERNHCRFIRDTLVPDLRESGTDATADDFDELLKIISDLAVSGEWGD